ncbi:hypothetical protein CEXT_71111, partial [Caerostris extrusa]
ARDNFSVHVYQNNTGKNTFSKLVTRSIKPDEYSAHVVHVIAHPELPKEDLYFSVSL